MIINVPANYVFIYGEFGAPALGGAGCGLATAIVYWAMFIGMLVYCLASKKLKVAPLWHKMYWPNLNAIKGILMLGVPIAMSLLFEVSLFSVVAIILAPFGANVVASHQIAINFSGLVFMVPLSLAMAVTIKVGFAVGDKDHQGAKMICKYSILLGLLIAIVTATLSLIFKRANRVNLFNRHRGGYPCG